MSDPFTAPPPAPGAPAPQPPSDAAPTSAHRRPPPWRGSSRAGGDVRRKKVRSAAAHRDVLPMAGTTGFDPEAWCPDCQFYKLRRTPKKRDPDDYRY